MSFLHALRHAIPPSIDNSTAIASTYQKYEAQLLATINGKPAQPKRRYAPSKRQKK